MRLTLLSLLLVVPAATAQKPAPLEPGLHATYTSLAAPARIVRDVVHATEICCFVASGQPPTPFLPGGRFNLMWKGFISVDLRSEYRFQADVHGDFKLSVNGQQVLEFKGNGTSSPLTPPVRLRKGTNEIFAVLSSSESGQGFVRLQWTDSETALRPVPAAAFTHDPNLPGASQAEQLRLGRQLFIEHRCAQCHRTPLLDALPEKSMDAPALAGIGSRRKPDWLRQWVKNPSALRPQARMPQTLFAPEAAEEATAIGLFLASLRDDQDLAPEPNFTDEDRDAGTQLFQGLLCAGCHIPPGEILSDDPDKVGLADVNAKFTASALMAFLLHPNRHYAWIRMPDFKLHEDEARRLTAYLVHAAKPAPAPPEKSDQTLLDRGRLLVQSRGCLNCHQLDLENRFATSVLADLHPDSLLSGCLADAPDPMGLAPRFSFSPEHRVALRAFLATDRSALGRHNPAEFAHRQTSLLRCAACHGQQEGFPALAGIGSKLRPEWMTKFIGGELSYRPRPWLDARMPAFAVRAAPLAEGLAALSGFAPQTKITLPLDSAAAAVGHKLVGKENGFSCIACHGVRTLKPTEVFEAEGINLGYAAERLHYQYYRRWVLDPLLVDPQTKMPDYFEGLASPLTDYYDGDGAKQIDAIWNYLRLGDKMPLPNTGAGQ